MRPPHSGGLNQVTAKQPGPAEPEHLGSQNDKQRNKKRQVLLVKKLYSAHYMNGVDVASPGVGENGDEHVLLDIEGARVEREFPFLPLEENAFRNQRCHEAAERDHRDLSRDRGEGERLPAVPEELVEE